MLGRASKVSKDPQDPLVLLDRRALTATQDRKEIKANRATEALLAREVRRVRRVRRGLRGAAVGAVLQELKAQRAIKAPRVQPEIKDRLGKRDPEGTKE